MSASILWWRCLVCEIQTQSLIWWTLSGNPAVQWQTFPPQDDLSPCHLHSIVSCWFNLWVYQLASSFWNIYPSRKRWWENVFLVRNIEVDIYSKKKFKIALSSPTLKSVAMKDTMLLTMFSVGLVLMMSFRIVNRTKFEQQVMVAFFPRMKGYASFQRQLNLYEFRRCMDGRYWHECFIRNDPALLIEMRRTKANGNQSSGEGNNKLSRTTPRNRDTLIAQVMSKETEWWYHCSNHDFSQWFSFRWQTSSCSAKGTIKWQRQLCCSQLSQHNHCQTTERYSEFFV